MTRKIFLSLLVIAAVVAAIGLVTFAIFSDNIASDQQDFAAGSVDIQVNGEEANFETTLDMPNMEPGDCEEQTLHVFSNSTLPIFLQNWIYTKGDIFACDPNPDCNMKVWKEYQGDDGDGIQESLVPGETEDWLLKACLPLCAGNSCQLKSGFFNLFFHAYQQSNMEGFECVKLEDKDKTFWMPNPLTPPHGTLCYKVVDDGPDTDTCQDLRIVVNAYGLSGGQNFQLDVTGGDTNDAWNPGCQPLDDLLKGMSTDLFVSGYWNWGSTLEATCVAGNGGEGVFNYAGVYGGVQSDASGNLSYDATFGGWPVGSYQLKSHVKEIGGAPPGTSWTEVLAEMDYLKFDITCTP